MALLLATLLALQQQPTVKDEIIRLSRAGASEETLLTLVRSVKLKLSVDDIVEMKRAGVSEKVITRLIEGPSEAKVVNLAHKSVGYRLIGNELHLGCDGTTIAPGQTVQLPLSGDYSVWVGGRETSCRVKTPATLTFRGSNHPEFEVVTLYVEDARGSDTVRVESHIR